MTHPTLSCIPQRVRQEGDTGVFIAPSAAIIEAVLHTDFDADDWGEQEPLLAAAIAESNAQRSAPDGDTAASDPSSHRLTSDDNSMAVESAAADRHEDAESNERSTHAPARGQVDADVGVGVRV